MSSARSRRAGDSKGLASVSRGGQADKDHTYLTVKLPANKLRQATTTHQHGSSISVSSDSATKRPTRGNKKNYVVDDSDSDVEEEEEEQAEEEEEEEEEEDEIQVGALAGKKGADDGDESALDPDDEDDDAGADDMDIDAEGEEDDEDADAEGEEEYEMTPAQPAPTIKISKPAKTSPSSKKTRQPVPKKATGQASSMNADNSDDDDDDELSDLDSDDEAMNLDDDDAEGEDEDADMDAEGEEIEDDRDVEGEPDADATVGGGAGDMDSDEDGSHGETPDLSRMTQRQRARFEGLDETHYQALSNEVQAKKVFTVEEKAMRRAEMARRRRNLSEKRNEEVKQETINKLLKKQAGKTNRKGLTAIGEDQYEDEDGKPHPMFIRWTSTMKGNMIAVPEDIVSGPTGRMFANTVRPSSTQHVGPRRMVEVVEEVS